MKLSIKPNRDYQKSPIEKDIFISYVFEARGLSLQIKSIEDSIQKVVVNIPKEGITEKRNKIYWEYEQKEDTVVEIKRRCIETRAEVEKLEQELEKLNRSLKLLLKDSKEIEMTIDDLNVEINKPFPDSKTIVAIKSEKRRLEEKLQEMREKIKPKEEKFLLMISEIKQKLGELCHEYE